MDIDTCPSLFRSGRRSCARTAARCRRPCRIHASRSAASRRFRCRTRGWWLDAPCHLHPLTAQRLLAFLALHDRPLSRLFVAGSLWPDTAEVRSSANLRSALWRLRRPGTALVKSTAQHLNLHPDVVVDLRETSDLVHRILNTSADVDPGALATSNESNDLLIDWSFDWVLLASERLLQRR